MIRIQEFIRQSSPKDDIIVLRNSSQDGNKPMKTKEYRKSTGMPPSFRIITSPPFSLPGVCMSQYNESDNSSGVPFCPRVQDGVTDTPSQRKKSSSSKRAKTKSTRSRTQSRRRTSRQRKTRNRRKQSTK